MTQPYSTDFSVAERIPAVDGFPRRAPVTSADASVAWHQVTVVFVIILLTGVGARLGLGSAIRYFFVLSGLACAAFYIRRSPWQYITITLWFWTITPLARRLIDYGSGFDATNFVLATPSAMTLLMVRDLVRSRELLRLPEAALGLFILLPTLYGLFITLVQGDLFPAAAAGADWIGPLLYYFYILANWRSVREAEPVWRGFLTANGVVIVAYGLYQFFSPPIWDVIWVIGSRLNTVGKPEPYGLRIFGTLNVPGTLAIWLSFLLLMAVHFRTKVSAIIIPAGAILLLMTLVRSSSGGVVFGLIIAGLLGRAGTFKMLGASLFGIALTVGIMSIVTPDITDRVGERFGTIGDLGNDTSALERTALYSSMPTLLNENPMGMGIGSIGRGAVAAASSFVTVDSGPLAIYLTMGWLAGSVYLAGMALLLTQAVLVARSSRTSLALAVAVTALGTACNLLFTSMTGLFAVVVWITVAYSAALGVSERNQRLTAISAQSRG